MSVLLVPHNTLNIVILQLGFWDCGSPACTEGDSEPSASQSLRELQMFTGGLRQDPCWHVPLHQCRAAHPGWGTGSVQGNLPHFFARPLCLCLVPSPQSLPDSSRITHITTEQQPSLRGRRPGEACWLCQLNYV